MQKPIPTLLVGIGGYGATYVNLFLDGKFDGKLSLVGAVDPYAHNSKSYDLLKDRMPICSSMDDFFVSHKAELVIVCTPAHLHYEHCVTALKYGAHVLCEKPLVPTLADLDRLQQVCGTSDKALAVGFQHCYSDVMLALKKRVLAGEFGRPVTLKNYISWPRTWAYYGRGIGWAGKIKTDSGAYVNDSVVSNAMAHFIQNAMFLLGPNMNDSIPFHNIQVECYRVNDIESFDTIAFKGRVVDADIYFYASHATRRNIPPIMDYKFENARIMVNVLAHDYECTIHHQDGRIENLGMLLKDAKESALRAMIRHIRGEHVFLCTTNTVRPYTAFIDAIFENVPFHDFPDSCVVIDYEAQTTYVKNLHLDLLDCFNQNKLPSEAALPWAKAGTCVMP